jgi:hypothetical protein
MNGFFSSRPVETSKRARFVQLTNNLLQMLFLVTALAQRQLWGTSPVPGGGGASDQRWVPHGALADQRRFGPNKAPGSAQAHAGTLPLFQRIAKTASMQSASVVFFFFVFSVFLWDAAEEYGVFVASVWHDQGIYLRQMGVSRAWRIAA